MTTFGGSLLGQLRKIIEESNKKIVVEDEHLTVNNSRGPFVIRKGVALAAVTAFGPANQGAFFNYEGEQTKDAEVSNLFRVGEFLDKVNQSYFRFPEDVGQYFWGSNPVTQAFTFSYGHPVLAFNSPIDDAIKAAIRYINVYELEKIGTPFEKIPPVCFVSVDNARIGSDPTTGPYLFSRALNKISKIHRDICYDLPDIVSKLPGIIIDRQTMILLQPRDLLCEPLSGEVAEIGMSEFYLCSKDSLAKLALLVEES